MQNDSAVSVQDPATHAAPGGAALNQVFGWQVPRPGVPSSFRVIAGARQVDIPTSQWPWQVQVFAYPGTCLRTYLSEEYRSCVYVWGVPAHAQMKRSAIPAWCAEIVGQRRFSRFTELLGTFVVIVDDPLEQRITFVSDILGIRPLFVGKRDGRIVFGSDVWMLHQANATTGECDYGAVSSWLTYRYNCTGGSLFVDLRRLPPATAMVIQDGRATEVRYATLEVNSENASAVDVADAVHQIVSSNVKTLLADDRRCSVPLSGGFDSRYLLGLCLAAGTSGGPVVNVSFTDQEGNAARRVAEAFDVPLETIPVEGSVWDIYDEVYHFTADGFPISKFVTHCIAQRYQGMPMVNGFMGDSLVRGSNDMCAGRHEQEWRDPLAVVLQQKHLAVSYGLFRPPIAKRVLERSLLPMEQVVRQGSGKVFGWGDLYIRQRHYISNNFLQHLGLAEAWLPFYSWELMSYKMAHDYRIFNKDVYRQLFKRYFPTIADLPHAADLGRRNEAAERPRCMKRWARELLPALCRKDWLDLLAKQRCVPLLMLGASPLPSLSRRLATVVEDAVLMCQRLHLLEQRVKEAKLDFDWNRV